MKAIHDAGFSHRDIKPDNILFVKGVPKLADIGLLSSLSVSMTQFAGTLEFIPPEERTAENVEYSAPAARQRNDLYALGKVIYCTVTGNSPSDYPAVPPTMTVSLPVKLFLRLAFQLCRKEPEGRLDNLEDIAAAFAVLQNSDTDKAMYYDAFPTRAYCGLYEFPSNRTTPVYDVFKNYNILYKLGRQYPASTSDAKVKILAAANGKDAAIMLANHTAETKCVTLEAGSFKFTRCLITDENRRSENIAFDGKITLPPYSLAFLFTAGAKGAGTAKPGEKVSQNHAGLDAGN